MSRENAYFCNVQLHAVCHVKVKLVLNQAEQASVNIRLRVVRSYFPANNIIKNQNVSLNHLLFYSVERRRRRPGARSGDQFYFSVARNQMLVA